MKITERKKEILREVILRFIEHAEPIPSQSIAENSSLELSSATIRKEMAELEEMGYLNHPHTSAGRIPSDKGYRFFVDNFVMDRSRIEYKLEKEVPPINIMVEKDMEIETILQRSSEQLAKITNYLSMIVAPAVSLSKLRHLEILKFQSSNFLLVIITDAGRVFKRNFRPEGTYNNLDLQGVSNILNTQLREKNIADIDYMSVNISESDSYLRSLIKKIIEVIKTCAKENLLYNRIFVYGTSSVLSQPEFIDLEKIKRILNIIGNEYLLMKLLLNLSLNDEFIIKIGSEIFEEEVEGTDDLSLVASKYKVYGHSTGTIGVLGPKRMNYYRVINILDAFVENLKEIFDSRT
jgi:heat-inducible transcriptional repressor